MSFSRAKLKSSSSPFSSKSTSGQTRSSKVVTFAPRFFLLACLILCASSRCFHVWVVWTAVQPRACFVLLHWSPRGKHEREHLWKQTPFSSYVETSKSCSSEMSGCTRYFLFFLLWPHCSLHRVWTVKLAWHFVSLHLTKKVPPVTFWITYGQKYSSQLK